ncbi:MAG: hypothetical protein EBS74_09410, partial [Flavobacteriia bacterium]|nr:hypothetical protein [Flavobacteriia bacterium]
AQKLVSSGLGVPDFRYVSKSSFRSDIQSAIKNKRGIWQDGYENHPKRQMYEYQSGMLSGEGAITTKDKDPSKTTHFLGGSKFTKSELKEIETIGIDAWEKKQGRGGQTKAKNFRQSLLFKGANRKQTGSALGLIPNFAPNVFTKRNFVYRPQGGKDWYTQLGGTGKHMNQFVKWLETNKKLPPKQMATLKSQFQKDKNSYEKNYWDEYKSIKSGDSSAAARRGFYGTNATSARSLPGEEDMGINITDPKSKLFIKKDKMESLINEWMNSAPYMFRGFVPNFAAKKVSRFSRDFWATKSPSIPIDCTIFVWWQSSHAKFLKLRLVPFQNF